MGMDVYGTNGTYFRNNVWWWHPLWNYCCLVAPEICDGVKYGHTNDGDGLNRVNSVALAEILRAEIKSGATAKYSREYAKAQKALPDEPCNICGGTGKRKEPPAVGPGKIKCNGCGGKGRVRPFGTNYPFSVENVREFAAFLEKCGGFEIH